MVHHFFPCIKSTELEAVVNAVWAQPERYGTDFDAIMSYLCQMVTKKPFSAICLYYKNWMSASEA